MRRTLTVLIVLALPAIPALVFGPWQLGALWLLIIAGSGLMARPWREEAYR